MGPDLISVSISPASGPVGTLVTVTVTAQDDTGIREITGEWERPHGNEGRGISFGSFGPCGWPVSGAGGTVTCSIPVTIGQDNYSGVYQLKSIYLEGIPSAGSTYTTKYIGPGVPGTSGNINGHGRGGVANEFSTTCCHNIEMPSFTVR